MIDSSPRLLSPTPAQAAENCGLFSVFFQGSSAPSSPRRYICTSEVEACRPWSQHNFFFFFLFFFSLPLNSSLLRSENKLPVISPPLKSPALTWMREICLSAEHCPAHCKAPPQPWVLPGETALDGCARHWWALVRHVRKVRIWAAPSTEARNHLFKKDVYGCESPLYIIPFKGVRTISGAELGRAAMRRDKSALWSVTSSLIMLSKSCLMRNYICSIWAVCRVQLFSTCCLFNLYHFFFPPTHVRHV